jgi:Protein of unknown function (DUF3828)
MGVIGFPLRILAARSGYRAWPRLAACLSPSGNAPQGRHRQVAPRQCLGVRRFERKRCRHDKPMAPASAVPAYKPAIIRFEDSMFNRRTFLLVAATSAFSASPVLAQAPSPNDPAGILTAIYARAAKGKGDGGGSFIFDTKAAKAKYLSKSLIALWAKADAHTPKGDVGPVDFDPVTNSQDPDVKSFKVTPEKQDADTATLAVAFSGHRVAPKDAIDTVVRYDLVHENGQWKIDDIKGTGDGEAWSIRGLLAESLKS